MTHFIALGLLMLATATLASTNSPLPLNADCRPVGSVCAAKLVCAGPSDGRRKCVRAMTEGKRCQVDPYWVCGPGLDCVDNICRVRTVPLGGSCAASGSVCADDLQCGGPTDARVCVKTMPVGGQCEHEPFWVCQEGLACEDNMCKVPEEGRCNGRKAVCVHGTVCAGTKFMKCVVPMREGESCGGDPFWVCAEGLTCDNGKCHKPKIPLGGSCAASGAVCADELRCSGPGDARVCVKTMPVGGRCEHEPFWVCEDGIICENNTCKIPKNGQCDDPKSVCVDGTVCTGTSSKQCVMPKNEGESCGKTSLEVCADGLNCDNGNCQKPKIQLGGSCSASGSVCADELQCAGPGNARVCVKTMPVGGRCEHEPFWVCKEGLACEKNVCKIPKNGVCNDEKSVCVDGTRCVGGKSKKCVMPLVEGAHCGRTSFEVCTDDLNCDNGKCQKPKVPLGGSCAASGSVCTGNLRCSGPSEARVCVKTMPVGGRCEHEPFWVCEQGLTCEGNICKIPKDGLCNSRRTDCVQGTICVGTSSMKCVMPLTEGKSCGSTSFDVCASGLTCDNGKCQKPKIPLGGSCAASGSVCLDDLRCAGPSEARVCVKNVSVGGRCEHEPFWVCKTGLTCEKNICKLPRLGNCTPSGSVCIDGTKCVGPSGRKKCNTPMPEGGKCHTDPYWFCQDGLVCQNNVCRKPLIPRGGNCTPAGSVCVDGTKCVGPSGRKKCNTPMPEGGKCHTDPYWFCQDGLVCEKNICLKPRIPRGGNCTPSGSRCAIGTTCVGPSSRRRCVRPMTVGKRCNTDPYWVCARGLECEGNVCKLPRGGNCSARGSVCVNGTVCAGPRHRKRCVTPMPVGKRCHTDPYWVCAKGVSCVRNVCRILVRLNGNCSRFGSLCMPGTICIGSGSRKKCVVGGKLGSYCRPPYRQCARGLRCDRYRCRISVSKGGSCWSPRTSCAFGLVCAGPRSRRRCVTPMRVGMKCQTDPYWVCANGLSCVHNICKKH